MEGLGQTNGFMLVCPSFTKKGTMCTQRAKTGGEEDVRGWMNSQVMYKSWIGQISYPSGQTNGATTFMLVCPSFTKKGTMCTQRAKTRGEEDVRGWMNTQVMYIGGCRG